MKKGIWCTSNQGSNLYTEANVGQIKAEKGVERVYVTLNPDSIDIIGPFRTPEGKIMCDLNLRGINTRKPTLEVVKAFRRNVEAVSPRAKQVLLELAIGMIVPTLPNDLQERGTEFSKQQLLDGFKRVRKSLLETPGSGEKISTGRRERK